MTITSCVFRNRSDAEQAITRLETAGITQDQISLIMTDTARSANFGLRESSKVEEGVTVGATAGGLIGAIAGAVASAGTLAIPGLNLIVTGALVPALAGLGAGGAAGGLIGGLVGSGVPEHEAKAWDNDVKAGRILLAVHTESDEDKDAVDDIFDDLKKNKVAA
jgi:hypothetical protein